ncbi:MAG: hypothetical protein WD081_03795 [Gammaproteobacteria bacterium]
MSQAFGVTLFCDDIRHEVGGKVAMSGIYGESMLLPQFPAVLPKLGVFLILQCPASEPFNDVTIRVLLDNEAILEGEINVSQSKSTGGQADEDSTEDSPLADRVHRVKTLMVVSPFKIEKPCTLRVRAITPNGELKCGSLPIKLSKDPVAHEKAGNPFSTSGAEGRGHRAKVKSHPTPRKTKLPNSGS